MPVASGNDILHLKKLAPDVRLQIWLGGYDNNGNWLQEKSEVFHDYKQLLRNTQNRGVNDKKTKVKERNNRNTFNSSIRS